MTKDRYATPQGRARRLAVKRALRDLHEGPYSPARKEVWGALGVSEALYSRWCNPDEDACPDLFDIIAITKQTQNPALLRCLVDLSLEGFEIVATGGRGSIRMGNGLRLLERIVTANSVLEAGIMRDLNDDSTPGVIDVEEARRRLPDAKEALRTHQYAVDTLEGIAGTGRRR